MPRRAALRVLPLRSWAVRWLKPPHPLAQPATRRDGQHLRCLSSRRGQLLSAQPSQRRRPCPLPTMSAPRRGNVGWQIFGETGEVWMRKPTQQPEPHPRHSTQAMPVLQVEPPLCGRPPTVEHKLCGSPTLWSLVANLAKQHQQCRRGPLHPPQGRPALLASPLRAASARARSGPPGQPPTVAIGSA